MYEVSALEVKEGPNKGMWYLVGSIPLELAYEFEGTLEELEGQMRLPAKYRKCKTKLFKSEIEAMEKYKRSLKWSTCV